MANIIEIMGRVIELEFGPGDAPRKYRITATILRGEAFTERQERRFWAYVRRKTRRHGIQWRKDE